MGAVRSTSRSGDSNIQASVVGKISPGTLFLPAILLSGYATMPAQIVAGLLLVDLSLTFGSPVGVAGRIMSAASFIQIVVSLAMGALSIRFQHKHLLLLGLASIGIAALSCSLAPSLEIMMISYSLVGVGMGTITPMTRTLVGEHLPEEKRPTVVGWLMASWCISAVVGAQVIVLIAGLWGWRSAFQAYVLPVSLLVLAVAAIGVPSSHRPSKDHGSVGSYLGAFKGALSNRSAAACVLGITVFTVYMNSYSSYFSSFYRQRLSLSPGTTSILYTTVSLVSVLSSMATGRVVKKVGRKALTVVSLLGLGLFVLLFFNITNLPLSLVVGHIANVFVGFALSAPLALTIEQVPGYRPTLMALSSVATAVGATMASSMGGMTLVQFGYEGLGILAGFLGVAAAMVFQLLAIDPTKKQEMYTEVRGT